MSFEVYDVAIIPIITGLIELFKKTGLPKKYSPLVALALGVVAGVVYIEPQDIAGGIIIGIAMGLSASGLYEYSRDTIEGAKNKRNKNNEQGKE